MIYQTAAHIPVASTEPSPIHQRGTNPMTKLVLKSGVDRNGHRAPRYVRASPTVTERSFEHGVPDDITYLDDGGAILHVEDHATGLSSDSFIDTSSAKTVRRDTWAVLNKLLDRIATANARAEKPLHASSSQSSSLQRSPVCIWLARPRSQPAS